MKYRIIDHTADFGLEIFAPDLKTLFADAAHAMFEQIVDIKNLKGLNEYHIHVKGIDWPDLIGKLAERGFISMGGCRKLVKNTQYYHFQNMSCLQR